MFAWFRQRLHAEEGISLVEVLVGIMLVGLVLSALANTLTTSVASARQNEGLTHATALANQEFENLQGLVWDRLGLRPTDPNYTATAQFGSLTLHTVQVPAAVAGAPVATTTGIVRGNRTYTVRRFIVWRCNTAAETGAGCSATLPRYKQFRIEVSWSDGSGTRTTKLEGKRAVGTGGAGTGGTPLDLSDGAVFRVVSVSVTPDPIYVQNNGRLVTSDPAPSAVACATPPAAPAPGCGPRLPHPTNATRFAALQIEVETNHPASGVMVQWGGGTPRSMVAVAGTGGLRWMYQIFADCTDSAGLTVCNATQPFASPGPLDVNATATQVTTGATHTDSTQAYVAYPMSVSTPSFYFDSNGWRTTADPRICVANHSRMVRNDHQFIAGIRGLTLDDQVWVGRPDLAPTSTSVMALGQAAWQTDPAQPVYQGALTIAQIGVVPVGTSSVPFRISWLRSYDGVTGQWNFPVSVTTVGNGYSNAC